MKHDNKVSTLIALYQINGASNLCSELEIDLERKQASRIDAEEVLDKLKYIKYVMENAYSELNNAITDIKDELTNK